MAKILFKSTTLPRPKYDHGLNVPGLGSIQRRRWSYNHWEYEIDHQSRYGLFTITETEYGIAARLK